MANELFLSYEYARPVYCTVKRSDDKIFSVTQNIYVTEEEDDWADYAIVLVEDGEDFFAHDMVDDSDVGWYVAIYREQTASVAAHTDLILKTDRFYWTGVEAVNISTSPEPAILSSYSLITLNEAKRELNIDYLDTTKDDLITDIINDVMDTFEALANRKLKARKHRELCDTDGNKVFLKNWPVKRIYKLAFDRESAIKISYTGTDLQVTVGLTEKSLFITKIDSNGTETATEYLYTTYKTGSQIVTALTNAGITAELVDANFPSNELWPQTNINLIDNSNYYLEKITWSDVPFECDEDIGAVKILWSPATQVMVEYWGGYEEGDVGYHMAKMIVKQGVKILYDLHAKDWQLSEKQDATGNVSRYRSATELGSWWEEKTKPFENSITFLA